MFLFAMHLEIVFQFVGLSTPFTRKRPRIGVVLHVLCEVMLVLETCTALVLVAVEQSFADVNQLPVTLRHIFRLERLAAQVAGKRPILFVQSRVCAKRAFIREPFPTFLANMRKSLA